MIVKRVIHNGGPSEGELDLEFDSAESQTDHGLAEPPPSYEASSTPHSSVSDMDMKRKIPTSSSLSLAESPAQGDLMGESSSHPARRNLPSTPPKPVAPTLVEHIPGPSHTPFHSVTSHEQPLPSEPPSRPRLPHAAQSAPDPRGKAKVEHHRERDAFGNTFYDEGPFAAARRAQRVPDVTQNSSDNRTYSEGRMPSFKPGEIVPVNTMGPATNVPPFFPPHQAPSFPPNINYHSPIRPAHFPSQLHPTRPPEARPQPTLIPSRRHSPPAQPPVPVRSQSTRQRSAAPPSQSPMQLQAHPETQTQQQSASFLHGHPPPSVPSHSMPTDPPMPPQTRRYTYDARGGAPHALTPNGRLGNYSAGPSPDSAQPQALPPLPHGRPQQHPQAYYAPERTPGSAPHPSPLVPGRSILRQPQRHSVQATPPSHSILTPPPPAPVRLPSQNVPPPSPHSLGIVHAPPAPSSSPLPDPTRPPRHTPKPVMPQLLEPLAAHDNNYGRPAPPQLQRSVSTMALEKGGLLSKTRSILRKRSSTSGIKTHADGAITYAPQAHPSKRYENHAVGLASVKEERGGALTGKLSKRLSKKK